MKKGFTLVELLAVMVILAILAVIITPIVINLINEAEVGAELRSAELYVNAVEHDVASAKLDGIDVDDGTYPIMSDGNLCLGVLTNDVCEGNVFEIKATGSRPSKGFVAIESKVVTDTILKYEKKNIRMEEKGIFAYKDSICFAVNENEETFGNVPEGNYLPGDEYMCEVKDGTTYRFYVLSIEGENVNLMLERNIASTGALAGASTGRVPWVSYDDYTGSDYYYYGNGSNLEGPITAMNFLHNATKDWINVDNIDINYTDEGNHYGGIYTEDTTTKITRKNGIVTATYENLKTRMAKLSELTSIGCLIHSNSVDNSGSCPLWAMDYIRYDDRYCSENYSKNQLTGIYGYWTLSSNQNTEITALTAYCSDLVKSNRVDISNNYGVRPVISVSKYLIEN